MRIIDHCSIKVTRKLFTFSLFILTICQKLPIFLHGVLWAPKLQNLYILIGMDEGVLLPLHFLGVQSIFFRCTFNPLQMRNQSFSNFNFRIFEILPLLLGWLAPVFMMIYSYFYDEVVQYRLNPHGYCLDFVSDVDCNIFLPRIQNFQAEKIIVSCRENFMFNTRIHFILYENEVYSGKEWSVFS